MICITGRSSNLKCTLFPPLDLTSAEEWEMGFMDLMTYNSIPNIEQDVNNKIYIGKDIKIELPTGAYEIDDINNFVIEELKLKSPTTQFKLEANNNTLKSQLSCSLDIDFTKDNTIAPLLGFNTNVILEANKLHKSPNQVFINKVDIVRVTCNLVRGSYKDGVEGHVLHEFYPTVAPGFKIVEIPNTVKYLPINKQLNISDIYINLEDQSGNLVNFREELINIRIDIRPRQK